MTWKEGVNCTLMNLADDAILGGAASSSKHRKLTRKRPSEITNMSRKEQKRPQTNVSAAGKQTRVHTTVEGTMMADPSPGARTAAL